VYEVDIEVSESTVALMVSSTSYLDIPLTYQPPPAKLSSIVIQRPVRLAYQPPASSTFLSE
jgi:hypothetical protein